MLKDSEQRKQATDPCRSFIVQAPAGSGKTEILTQRYLRLLGTVSAPEQIVALTFTRKAASEMRERILVALKHAADGVAPNSAHQQQTFQFAKEALACSERYDWQLLQQPGRLKIMTIDALCQAICQAIPLQEKQVPYAEITDNPHRHYEAAARACLEHALAEPELHQPLKNILTHLDNRQDKLLALFINLLANRDQWLSNLYLAKEQTQACFEDMLKTIENHELNRFKQTVPINCRDELCTLARQIAHIENNPQSPRYSLQQWQQYDQLNRDFINSLAALLLTSQNNLRQSFDHHVGLKRGACDNQLYDSLKSASKELLAKLSLIPNLLEALVGIKDLPSPTYDQEQWQVLQSLFTLLPLLVGHLHVIFSEKNELDFSAVSQQALFALGDETEPTDLALYFDNAIHHLLVDEFQDTSIQQFQLLAKLVHGWQINDGKTLFVVGDPMQSIYRFRQAEVGLFLKTKQEGLGSVHLESLELCCNFRSSATIVDWVNKQFKTIFPPIDDIESGAIAFHPSVNILAATETSKITAHQFSDRRKEADAVVSAALKELNTTEHDSIAILVRSRTQLMDITRLLREQKIPFQGVEIEFLSTLPHLRDLWSLTQALLMPANRLAWLALLRSPFCGLSLAELHVIANVDKKKSIYYALSQLDTLVLGEENRQRLQFVYEILKHALACRHQDSVVDWVAHTFKQLHGEHILDSEQQADLEQFWLLLERFAAKSYFPDLEQFKIEFNKLYSQRSNSSRLQVMTIHKSKGLEFDCVILPGLSTKSQSNDHPLLRWLKLPSTDGNDLFLVSPIKPAHRDECLVYNYLAKLDAEKGHYELQRLLYVAVTRAKQRLCLFDSSEKETKGTFRSLLKAQEFVSDSPLDDENTQTTMSLPTLYRLPHHFYQQTFIAQAHENYSTLIPTINNARQIGIVTHELLQWICNHHPLSIDELPWWLVTNRFQSMGFSESELAEACNNLRQQISLLFNEPIGQWLIQAHDNEANEYALFVNNQGTNTRIIDRTFIDGNYRWVIDFKTGNEEEKAQTKHRQQVNEYASYFAMTSPMPIRCGVYYLATGHWLQWDYKVEAGQLELP